MCVFHSRDGQPVRETRDDTERGNDARARKTRGGADRRGDGEVVRGTSDASRRWVTPHRFPPCRAPRPMDRRLGTRPGGKRSPELASRARARARGSRASEGTHPQEHQLVLRQRRHPRGCHRGTALRPRQRAENCCLERAAQKTNSNFLPKFTPCSGEFPSLRLFARTGLLSSRNSRTRD